MIPAPPLPMTCLLRNNWPYWLVLLDPLVLKARRATLERLDPLAPKEQLVRKVLPVLVERLVQPGQMALTEFPVIGNGLAHLFVSTVHLAGATT